MQTEIDRVVEKGPLCVRQFNVLRDWNLSQGHLADLVPQIDLLIRAQGQVLVLEQIHAKERVMIARLLLGESYIVLFAIVAREVTLRQVYKARRVRFGRRVPLVALSARLLVKLDVVVLLERALPIEKLRGGTTQVSTATHFQVAVPALAQQAHVVINPIAKLAAVVEGDD